MGATLEIGREVDQFVSCFEYNSRNLSGILDSKHQINESRAVAFGSTNLERI